MNIIEERTIALAGVLQASILVQSLARTGHINETGFESSVKSILVLDAINASAIYGGLQGIQMGLVAIKQGKLGSSKLHDIEVLQYAMYLMQLQTQLYRKTSQYRQFSTQIERLSAVSADELVESCSEIYRTFFSPMKPQILVQGEEGFLQKDGVASQVRALLLAGIRSSVLWQQKGGGRLKLIWQRGQFVDSATTLLNQLTPLH